ncbi:PTS system trehalose-specific IIC component [Geomicrobium halophilum]|uniref:PTS system trehalose-specific IIC component n=1 Tax=Geomicrobium halophilum TaxID=549000 RepID=A0A841Q1Y0_9BACL|nr:PTS system trehalose-specific EIIBC component [Geomicrobium halophilum]MBB6450098.1 PTS system trehalose-specific IIC component [Geomicrobium halophilum]
MSINYRKTAQQVLELIGGEENISSATHCVTRLRIVLNDTDQVNTEELERVEAVKGSFYSNGQLQIILGNGVVDKVYKELMEITGREEQTKDEAKEDAANRGNPLQRAIKVLADVFIPILPAIVTAGLLLGINNILTGEGIFFDGASVIDVYPQWADFAEIINVIASTAFVFLPALIGWSVVKRFGGSPLLGIVLGLILVHPDLMNAHAYGDAVAAGEDIPTWSIFGLEIEAIGYQGQVLPIFVAGIILAKLEVFLRKYIPNSLQLLLVAPIALLLTGFLAFIFIGPITFAIGNWIIDGFIWLFGTLPMLAGLLYGALYAPLVITGMHHTFLAVDLQLTTTADGTFLWPILALSNIAQGSAAFAMYFVLKNQNLKGLSGTSGLTAWLGVTEPALFGVNLRFRFPFLCAIIGSSIAGMYITINQVLATTVGVGGVPGIFSIQIGSWGAFAIGMVIVIIVPFISTLLVGRVMKPKSLNE